LGSGSPLRLTLGRLAQTALLARGADTASETPAYLTALKALVARVDRARLDGYADGGRSDRFLVPTNRRCVSGFETGSCELAAEAAASIVLRMAFTVSMSFMY
jgi:hypothetical protein